MQWAIRTRDNTSRSTGNYYFFYILKALVIILIEFLTLFLLKIIRKEFSKLNVLFTQQNNIIHIFNNQVQKAEL